MTCYLVESRDWVFVKGYGFLSFPRNMGKDICRSISKILSTKYSQKLLDHAIQSAANAFKTTSKRAFQKTAEATGDLILNKIADRITKVLKTSSQNNSESNEGAISKERYISPEQRLVDNPR